MAHMKDKQNTIDQIREFNRFYTVLLGFLNRNYLDSGYSITETRILFELKQNPQMSANQLIELLHLDKSYISRLIRNFEQKEIVTRQTSLDDGRARIIQLTPKGQREADRLINITDLEISKLIEPLRPETRGSLCEAMETIIRIFRSHTTLQEVKHGSQD